MALLSFLLLLIPTLCASLRTPHHGRVLSSSGIRSAFLDEIEVPKSGLIDYIGDTKPTDSSVQRWNTHHISYRPVTEGQLSQTRFNLWRQKPWKKFKGKALLKIRLGGDLPLESTPKPGLPFGGRKNLEPVESLSELQTLLMYAAYDPRVLGIFVELGPLSTGYAKLQEVRRYMDFFRESGKEIIGFAETASEKELYLSMGFNEFYVPPDGGLDLRGFSASATFVRGVFEKIGIEPQVQRIGKYKSFGDTFNRTSIADAQREVISSLLTEASDFWVDSVAKAANKTSTEIRQIWAETKVQSPEDFRDRGLITGVKYFDQVEEVIKHKFSEVRKPSFFGRLFASGSAENETALVDAEMQEKLQDFDLQQEFIKHPRRNSSAVAADHTTTATGNTTTSANATEPMGSSKEATAADKKKAVEEEEKKKKAAEKKKKRMIVPRLITGGGYLRRMRKGATILSGLPMKETRRGPRIAIINAVGGIASGESGNSGLTGKTLGSETLIGLIRRAKADPMIKAVVLRIDSPGGSALASDVMWRELRSLSRDKPVVASQVDVAASGGYYLSMACDEICAEELTVTGSIGVVTSKFNAEELNKKIGYNTETISIGRYAELFSTTRGFTEEEDKFFEANAQKFYKSFITKAALSRSMDVDAMNEVAQGRVWTGRQALQRGLVDHMGGLWKALEVAANMSNLHIDKKTGEPLSEEKKIFNVQTIREAPKGFQLPFGLLGASSSVKEDFGWGTVGAASGSAGAGGDEDAMAMCDDAVTSTGLVGADSLGMSPLLHSMGVSPILTAALRSSPVVKNLENQINGLQQQKLLSNLLDRFFLLLEELL